MRRTAIARFVIVDPHGYNTTLLISKNSPSNGSPVETALQNVMTNFSAEKVMATVLYDFQVIIFVNY